MSTIYIQAENEYDFGGPLESGRGAIFKIDNVKNVEEAKLRCIKYMEDNTDDFDVDLCSFTEFEFYDA